MNGERPQQGLAMLVARCPLVTAMPSPLCCPAAAPPPCRRCCRLCGGPTRSTGPLWFHNNNRNAFDWEWWTA